MKFVLFCEGHTEKKVLADFLKRWLDTRLSHPVRISTVRFQGWGDLYREVMKKAHLRLKEDDVIAIISLLDLYGPSFYPPDKVSAEERYVWGKNHIEKIVDHPKFYQFFAVHEIEAWLLSDPLLFTQVIRNSFPDKTSSPESVNFNEPPAKLLERIYLKNKRRTYKKVTQGMQLFSRLSPDIARDKCPRLKEMLDEMLRLAKEAGL